MSPHVEQARHNVNFLNHLVISKSPFNDWKVTVCFYAALHLMKGLGDYLGIDIGNTHLDIRANIDPNSRVKQITIKPHVYKSYYTLFKNSQKSRYDGFTDWETFQDMMIEDLKHSAHHLQIVLDYVRSRGVEVDCELVDMATDLI